MKQDIERLYGLIEDLKDICCDWTGFSNWNEITLDSCNGRMDCWKKSKRGIYLFFDPDEKRSDCKTPRIVRVGTHAIKKGVSKSRLWGRLRQHKGNASNGGGNHRGSIFRLLVGDALKRRDKHGPKSWDDCKNTAKEIRKGELDHEKKVSEYIRKLPFLFVKVNPESSGNGARKYIEDNLIALLSNTNRKSTNPRFLDLPSYEWLGCNSSRDAVRDSGLWNNIGTQADYNPEFLECLEKYIKEMRNGSR